MNKQRRKEINEIINKLQNVDTVNDLEDCISDLENVRDDEDEYFSNIPENLQNSQRAYDSEQAIGTLDDVIDELTDACDSDLQEDWLDAADYVINELSAII